jgi:spore germination protein GerM
MSTQRFTISSGLAFGAMAVAIVTGCTNGGPPDEAAVVRPSPESTATAAPSPTAEAQSTESAGPPAPSPEASGSDLIDLKVYFPLYLRNDETPPVLVPVHRTVEATPQVGRAAIEALLAGPTLQEGSHDLRLGTLGTTIPDGTQLLGLEILAGVGTVDLSSEFTSGDIDDTDIESWAFRLAQVTYTLTQFPGIEAVRFRVDGRPIDAIEGHEGTRLSSVTRSAYFDQLPAVFVDDPAWNAGVGDTLTVSGIAQVVTYPSRFEIALVDGESDAVLLQQTVSAPCDFDCWLPPGGGAFEVELEVPDGAGSAALRLRVWELAPDEGGIVNVLEYPIH